MTVSFTIITVVLNDSSGFRRTANSLIPFLSDSIEWIVFDGGSQAKFLDVMSEYQQYISVFRSEPDQGVYFAMNDAAKKASGRYLLAWQRACQCLNTA